MTDHADARRLASAAVEGALSASDERELALHIVRCTDCKSFYDGIVKATQALRRAAPDEPGAEVVDAAVQRATTVLRGDADPGTLAREAVEAPPPLIPSPPDPPPQGLGQEPASEEAALTDVDRDTRPFLPPIGPPATPSSPPRLDELPDDLSPPANLERSPTELPREEPSPAEEPTAPEPEPDPEPHVAEPERIGVGPPSTTTEEPPPPEPPRERRSSTPRAPRGVLLAITATVLVAILALIVVTRRPGGGGTRDLPAADDLQEAVASAFDDLQSFKASFSLSRLSLYRVSRGEDNEVFSFSNGDHSGRIVFEGPDLMREEVTLTVPEAPEQRWTTVRKTEDVRTLTQPAEGNASLEVVANYPLGPPDGPLQHDLGILESALGSATRLIVDAADLQVVERTSFNERDAYLVRFSVAPDGFTRADRVEATIDVATSIPLRVRRSIARGDAGVLGPQELLTDQTLDAAFGERDRLTTELVELSNLVVDDVVLPGEFVLDVPDGVEADDRNGGYERVSRAELEDETPFGPLLPTVLPQGFREDAFALFTGEPAPWGPADSYATPSAVMQISYTDGKTTIVVALRRMPDGPFEIDGSPLAGGLPVTTRSLVRGGRPLSYGVAPDVPPHVFGFVGDVFVLVSGDVPEDDLLRVAASVGTDAATSPQPTPAPAS